MALLKVARMGHPVLRRISRPVDPEELTSEAMQSFIDDLVTTMVEEQGLGLAAPQVHTSLRMFAMDPPGDAGEDEDEDDGPGPQVLVNPVLSFPNERKIGLWEGCLSIPGIRGLTERWADVHVAALDRDGQSMELAFSGLAAVIVQHETDHLDGKFFLERMPDLGRLSFEEELSRYDDGDRVVEFREDEPSEGVPAEDESSDGGPGEDEAGD